MENACFMCRTANHIGRCSTLQVLPNGFPISGFHLLLVTREHREGLALEDLSSAMDFARAFPQYFVWHNMAGAGATRPEHEHWQAVLRDEILPIEAAPRKGLYFLDGAVVARVEAYPAYALTIRGQRAAEVVLALVAELGSTPFNLMLSREEVIVVPRRAEHPTGFVGKFGGLEMGGWVVFTGEEPYREITYGEIRGALTECGMSPADHEDFEWGALHALIRQEATRANGGGLRLGCQRMTRPERERHDARHGPLQTR